MTTSPHTHILYFFDQTPWLLFISRLILCGYYSRAAFISLESQERLDKVCTSETVTVARHCQWYAQPLSPAVSRGNNTNSPSASMVTIFRNHLHMCARTSFTSDGYYSWAAFISFRTSDGVATIRGWRLIEEKRYIHMYMHTCMHSRAHTHTPASFTVRKRWQQPHVSTRPITLIPCTFVSIPSSLHFCTII